jgi:hypothetical protein
MVNTAHVIKLVNDRLKQVLLVAEASLPTSQFRAFRTVVLNEFGRNGLVGDLERSECQKGAEEREGSGRNT